MPDNLDSSSTLHVKGKPLRQKRIGKKPMLIAMIFLFFISFLVIFNISHEKSVSLKRAETEKFNFKPAIASADDINGKIANNVDLYSTGIGDIDSHKNELQPSNFSNTESDENLAKNKLIQERNTKLKEALESASGVEQFKSISPQKQPTAYSATGNTPSPVLPIPSGQIVPALEKDSDQNRQTQKEIFLNNAAQNQNTPYLRSTRKAALSPLEIKTGTIIPSVLITGINSDLPGQIIGQVTENVYDTATGNYLLIPQGTKLYGSYDSHVTYGQNRLLVVWQRLVFPDASTLEIEAMTGSDKSGYAGFHDQVNNHYGRLIGFGLATSLFSSAFQISQGNNNSNNGVLTPSQIAATTTAQNMTQLGIDVSKRNLDIQPTIEIRPGYRFAVMINKDIIFPKTYDDMSTSNAA